jgi:hypothetical protein
MDRLELESIHNADTAGLSPKPGWFYTALTMEITSVYFKGEVSPYGWAKVPAYPLCGGRAPALLPVNFSWNFAW